MSRNLVQLCTLLLEEFYGHLSAAVFAALSSHGRLFAPQIAQRCHLPLRQVHHGLALLVQYHYVLHHTASAERTLYESDPRAVPNILRAGKLIRYARHRLSNDLVSTLERLVVVGPMTVPQLEDLLNSTSAEGSNTSTSLKSLQKLADCQLISRVQKSHFLISADVRSDTHARMELHMSTNLLKGKKRQILVRGEVDKDLQRRMDTELGSLQTHDSKVPSKRSATEHEDAPKAKVARFETPQSGRESQEQVLQVNTTHTTTILCNSRLTHEAVRNYGQLAGQTLGAALEQTPLSPATRSAPASGSSSLEDNPFTQAALDTQQLLLTVNSIEFVMDPRSRHPPSIGFRDAFGRLKGYRDTNGIIVNGHANGHRDNHGSQLVSLLMVEEQLHILAQEPNGFLRKDPVMGYWNVDRQRCTSHLKQSEVVRYIRVRFGSMAMRIVRILLDKGKVDERRLQEIGLFPAKELRQLLAEMKAYGFVKLQEVPREPQRQPNRTLFFWFFEVEEARQALLEATYKAVSRLLQRVSKERHKMQSTLNKVERDGVRGKEDQFLAPGELRSLRQWQRRERSLWMEIERLDDTLALMEA